MWGPKGVGGFNGKKPGGDGNRKVLGRRRCYALDNNYAASLINANILLEHLVPGKVQFYLHLIP